MPGYAVLKVLMKGGYFRAQRFETLPDVRPPCLQLVDPSLVDRIRGLQLRDVAVNCFALPEEVSRLVLLLDNIVQYVGARHHASPAPGRPHGRLSMKRPDTFIVRRTPDGATSLALLIALAGPSHCRRSSTPSIRPS
ncbi:hypothetical protein [Streptomyces roseoverticillatus]|uniref:hypothetical protein n=1 Tax=Streptomyces roseoverticillatus TaxID=66429 RepID=UPI0012FEA0B7|nr:hypothetical protein [Streptomyces roseoverticillatus]